MRITSRTMIATSIAASAIAACGRPAHLAADLVVTHANIWTGNPAQPQAMAVAVIGDRIVDVGGADQIERWRGVNTTVVNAEGRRLVPGFNDAQVRFADGAIQLDGVDLQDAATPAEVARRINERAKARPGDWIVGGRWDERRWTPPELPSRALIDDVTNSSPVFVVRYDGRMALANAAALGRAGITERTPDPPGGRIVRDANGFPTGVMAGTAMALVARAIPKPTPAQRLQVMKRALELAESLGITSVQDLGADYEDIAVYGELANRGELTVRVYAASAEDGWYDQAKLGVQRGFGSPWLRIGAVHAVFDDHRDRGEMRTRLMAADHAGLQLSVETKDGAAPVQTLELLEAIAEANGGRDRRLRIDGAAIAVDQLDRLSGLNAIALLQPSGAEAVARAVFDKGVRVALGSGWPAAPLNPMRTLQAAMGAHLEVEEALAAQTRGPAFAEFQDSEKGTIARGKLADMVILSEDILAIPPARIKDVRALTTIVGGRVVHQRKP